MDTDHEDEVFDDDFDTDIQNQDIIIRKQIQSLDKQERDQVQLQAYYIFCMSFNLVIYRILAKKMWKNVFPWTGLNGSKILEMLEINF